MPDPVAVIARHVAIAPFADRVAALGGTLAEATPELVEAVLGSAGRFADAHLVPLNRAAERAGCRLVDGRVVTVAEHKAAWAAYREGGYLGIEADPAIGGAGLPQSLAAAVQEVMDRACPAFGMMPVPLRAGARLVAAFADARTREEWLPRFVSGEWGATICISEPDAGSDVRRMRTRAVPDGDGWRVSGEKCWISFGDQDVTARIGHLLLAKTAGDAISLFLVPDAIDGARNGVVVRRIEEKLGLHASPTCALGFEAARAVLLGEEGRGLQQLFVMIAGMRLATGVEGAGIAGRALDVALGYAQERRQGGAGERPVPIAAHADVQRMLLGMAARVETLRGLNHAIANLNDLAARGDAGAGALAAWLLPIAKTLGGEVAFGVASEAIQVLGGAGYTREWPVEQCLRDARVLTIFEGTTGMQAQDLLHRRLLGRDRSGYAAFLAAARSEGEPHLDTALDRLEAVAAALADRPAQDRDAGAVGFLDLAGIAATGWIAARLAGRSGDAIDARLAAAGVFALSDLPARAEAAAAQALAGAGRLAGFAALG